MSVLKKDELMNRIKEKIGDDTSDESLKFLEDITDTFNDLETKLKPNKKTDEEWQAELETKDKEWREKYKARFFESVGGNDEDGDSLVEPEKHKPTPEESITVDDLFSEKGDK